MLANDVSTNALFYRPANFDSDLPTKARAQIRDVGKVQSAPSRNYLTCRKTAVACFPMRGFGEGREIIVAKSRKRIPHVRRGMQSISERKHGTKQPAKIKLKEEIKEVRRFGWTRPMAVVAIAALLVTVAGLAVEITRLSSQLDGSDFAKRAADVAATEARKDRSTALQERDKALEDVKKLEQQTKQLASQVLSHQKTTSTQRNIIDDPQKLLESQNAILLDRTRNGTEIEPGEEVKEGMTATVQGNLVMPDQGAARFVAIDALRANKRIATTISDKNGRFSLKFPRGDEVALKFMAAGRMTSDITLSGKHHYHLKVLFVERHPVQLQE